MKFVILGLMACLSSSVFAVGLTPMEQCRKVEATSDQAPFCQQVDNVYALACVQKIPAEVVNCSLMHAAEGVDCLNYLAAQEANQVLSHEQVQACGKVANKFSLECVKSIKHISAFQINSCAYHVLDSKSLKCVLKKSTHELTDIEACDSSGAMSAPATEGVPK